LSSAKKAAKKADCFFFTRAAILPDSAVVAPGVNSVLDFVEHQPAKPAPFPATNRTVVRTE
jgi:hypothetical protein